MNSDMPDWLTKMIGEKELPILDLGKKVGHTDYIDFVRVDDVSAPIMRGVDVYRRPFVTIRVIDRETNKMGVHTLFRRYTDEISNTWCCGSCYKNIIGSYIRDFEREYLNRLFKHEPCGMGLFYGEEETRITDNGQSVIEIC